MYKVLQVPKRGNSSSWGSWGELLAMSVGKGKVSAQIWGAREEFFKNWGANWRWLVLGGTSSTLWPLPKGLGRRLGGEPLGVGGKRLQSRPSPTVAAKVPWSIFLLMVLLTVVERGCLPHITSFLFLWSAALLLLWHYPLPGLCPPVSGLWPHSIDRYVSLAMDTTTSMPWLLGQGHNPAVFIWITEEVEFCFPAGFDAERGGLWNCS